jgi:hypothetical protein
MRYFLLVSIFFFGFSITAISQSAPQPAPTPDPALMREIEWRSVKSHLDRLDNLQKVTSPPNQPAEDNKKIILDALYRRSTGAELSLLAPDDEDRTRYSSFLKQPGTGLIKLIRDFGCDDYSSVPRNEQVCQQFTMPGGGSAFSFRQADYQVWKLADLLYDGKSFLAFGQMSLGFMVDLGNVPLENIRPDLKELAFMMDFVPAQGNDEVVKQNTSMIDGLNDKGMVFKKFLPVKVDDTYVIRSIAFKGKVPREHYNIKYDELDFDHRKDIVAVFRVLHQDFNGTATILWKILQTKPSPELRNKNEK